MKRVFMDHASTTKVDPEVLKAMLPFFSDYFGNPSSVHSFGRETRNALDQSRRQIADLFHAKDNEIIFTAGGTESDNIAVKGVAYQNKDRRKTKGPHILTSVIEHPAVLESCRHLEKQGFKIKYLPVDSYGMVKPDEVEQSLTKDTFLITIMAANNEIGTIEPIQEIGMIAREHDVLFHTDAVQAIGKVPIDVQKMKIDMLSASSHKMYGPKGIGGLYIREDAELQPIIHGGGHERGLRSSTHNLPGIVGFAKACELAAERIEKDTKYIRKLRDSLIENVLRIEESYLNGHPEKRLCNNAHFRFTGVEGESLLLGLDERGIASSTGSACASEKEGVSHVLTAIGLRPVEASGSIRLTLGRESTMDDVSYVSDVLPEVVDQLRQMSPIWNR